MATVVRFALIGKDVGGNSLFRLLLDVREPSGSTFRTERALVLGADNAIRMRDGHRVLVQYFPGNPASVLYEGECKAGS